MNGKPALAAAKGLLFCVPVLSGAAALQSLAMGDERTWDYPAAERGPVVDNYFGTPVADPYRWMEDLDSGKTRDWAAAENRLTFGFLEKLPQRAWFRERLEKLWNTPKFGLPHREGGRLFFERNDGLQNQPVLYVQDAGGAAPPGR
jgi:prolyl oligopeptidase